MPESPPSYEQFVADHSSALLRYAYIMTGDRDLAEDLAQEALLKAMRHWTRVSRTDRPAAYVRRIIANEYATWWRRTRRWREILGLDPAPDLPDGIDTLAEHDRVWRALGTLSPRQRAVLVLRYYEALSDAEIARVLGCTEGTVRSSAARAFAHLRPTLSNPATTTARQQP